MKCLVACAVLLTVFYGCGAPSGFTLQIEVDELIVDYTDEFLETLNAPESKRDQVQQLLFNAQFLGDLEEKLGQLRADGFNEGDALLALLVELDDALEGQRLEIESWLGIGGELLSLPWPLCILNRSCP